MTKNFNMPVTLIEGGYLLNNCPFHFIEPELAVPQLKKIYSSVVSEIHDYYSAFTICLNAIRAIHFCNDMLTSDLTHLYEDALYEIYFSYLYKG